MTVSVVRSSDPSENSIAGGLISIFAARHYKRGYQHGKIDLTANGRGRTTNSDIFTICTMIAPDEAGLHSASEAILNQDFSEDEDDFGPSPFEDDFFSETLPPSEPDEDFDDLSVDLSEEPVPVFLSLSAFAALL